MEKWADFCITGVRYHPPRTAIREVEIRDDNGSGLSAPRRVTREAVVDAIDRGSTFVTAYRGPTGQFQRGEDVRVVDLPPGRYIRTDRNRVQRDNLDNLPEY
jgi:hypothetical protein